MSATFALISSRKGVAMKAASTLIPLVGSKTIRGVDASGMIKDSCWSKMVALEHNTEVRRDFMSGLDQN
jgi:hypothetical protein